MDMLRTRSIAFRLVLFILTSCSLIFASIFGYNYVISRRIITATIEENARNLALRTVNRIEMVLGSVEKVPENIAYSMEESAYTREGVLRLLRTVVENNPEIYGSTISYEPYSFDRKLRLFAPYYYKSGGQLKFTYLDEGYNYPVWDWYTVPRKLGTPTWTEPYYDKGGGDIIMSTYSVPFYRNIGGKRTFAGVVTADVYLSALQDIVSSIKVERSGYGFLISRNGTIVTHPDKGLIMKEQLPRIAEERHDAQLCRIVAAMMRGESGFLPARSILTQGKVWIGFEPIPSTGWSLGVVFPRDELMADVTSLGRNVFALGLLGVAVLLVVIIVIARSITRPLRALARATGDIARGKLDFTLPPMKREDEVGRFAASFVYMRDSLKKYIQELTETTAAKQRLESELAIARDIQMGMVPKSFPAFPGRAECDIYAALEPAREVGGDLYDFFFMDADRLCFVIGDVSGKGVPAALFMARTITLIKATAREVASPDEIMDRVNKELAHGNDSCMFVTVFCGILDVATGELCYVNAGHNPPLILREGRGAEFLAGGECTVLGIEDDTRFSTARIALRPGDGIFLYTDGVTEAFNGEREMFSEERLREEVSARRGNSAADMAGGLLQKVHAHAAGAPQSDDITVLVIRYLPPSTNSGAREGMTVVITNDLSEIGKLAASVAAFGAAHVLADDMVHDIRLALEEIAVNIIHYAYGDTGKHQIAIQMGLQGRELVIEVGDDGSPFNPLTVPPPAIHTPMADKREGGLGIFLARTCMDSVEYRRERERNILTMRKKI